MSKTSEVGSQTADVRGADRKKTAVVRAAACGLALALLLLACTAPVPFEFLTFSLKPAHLGQVYADTIRTAGGRGEVSMRISAGQLPPGIGLRVADTNGILYGTPTRVGDYEFTVEARDSSLTESPVPVELISHGFALFVDSL